MSDLDLQLSRLNLEEGDILVLRSRGKLSSSTAATYQNELQDLARAQGFRNVSVIVLDDCSDISIERRRSTAMQHQASRSLPTIGG